MNRNKDFIKNTLILFVGKFTSQFMSLLLIPLFTHFLTTGDYGTVDLLQTFISLFIPVLSLRIDSAVFRYLIDCRNDTLEKISIITNSILVLIFGIFLSIALGMLLSCFFSINYLFASIVNLVALITSSVLMQIQRGLGKNKEYSICCVIIGITTLILNVLFIVIFKKDAESILWASSLANFLGVLYILSNLRIKEFIRMNSLSKKKLKMLLKFSLPMIPDYLSGWIVNVSDRAIVSYVLGTAVNGIYTVSSKFSNILNSIFSIVNMSWQETASIHINDKDCDEYFSLMINNMIKIFSTIGLLMLVMLPLFYNYIIGESFKESYIYIPILIYANSWRVLVGTTNGIYIALKKTKEVANTTIVAAIINLLIHLSLIKIIGLYAACISTLAAYMIMGLYRYFDCRKYVKIRLDWKYVLEFTLIYLIATIIYLYNDKIINVLSFVIICIYGLMRAKKIVIITVKSVKPENKFIKKFKAK